MLKLWVEAAHSSGGLTGARAPLPRQLSTWLGARAGCWWEASDPPNMSLTQAT